MSAVAPRILRGEALREKIRTERGWCARQLLGQKPWPKQLEIEAAVFDGPKRLTEVSGCVGSTKTYGLAMVALTWLLAYKPSRVFGFAPSFRQVETNLWGYIRQLWAAAKAHGTPLGDDADLYQIPKIDLSCKPGCRSKHQHVSGWYYEGISTDEPHNVHGIHGKNDLVIIDDAHGIKQALAEELDNMLAGGNTKIVLAYNKLPLHGLTYDATHRLAHLYNHVGISYADLVAARAGGHALPGALDARGEEAYRLKYGPSSNFYRVKVLNLHPTQEKDTLVPLEWIHLAYDRRAPAEGPLVLGGDVGAQGDDASALASGRGRMVLGLEEWHEPDTMVTTGRFLAPMLAEEAHEDGKAARSRAYAFVDGIGIGAGVVNRMGEQTLKATGHRPGCRGCEERVKVEAVLGSEDAVGTVRHGGVTKDAKDVFKNLRSQVFWSLRELLDPANPAALGLPRDEELEGQLSCIRWRVGSDGRIEVEPKKGTALVETGRESAWGIKNRLGFSPDKADAVAYLAWGMRRVLSTVSYLSADTPNAPAVAVAPRADGPFMAAPLADLSGRVEGGLEGVS